MAYDRDRFDRDRTDRDRGFMDRAREEVRSWFGDDDAARRDREERVYRPEDRGYRREERSYRSEEPFRSEGYRDYGDRWGRSYSSTVDREREWNRDRDRDRYSRDYQPGPAFQAYTRGSQEFGPEGYGSPRAYESTREWDRGIRSAESWRVPGPHAGRGPRGYKRSDERVREEINDRLTAHGLIDATDVDVRVQNGEVTLTGFVDSREAKRAAEDLAEDVAGVREVNNQLRLRTHAEDAPGVGRTSVLGITEHETQTASTAQRQPEAYRSRTRTP
jgi:hypothetical protein